MRGRSLINLMSICFVGTFLSCKDDPPLSPLLGTWQYKYETYTDCDNVADEGRFDFPCNSTDCFKVTFQDKGKFIQNTIIGGNTTTINGTYSFDGPDLSMCSTTCSDPFSFSVTASTLTFTREDDAGCTVATVLEKIN